MRQKICSLQTLALLTSMMLCVLAVVDSAHAVPQATLGCSANPILQGAVRYSNLSNTAPGAKEIEIGDAALTTVNAGDVSWSGGKPVEFTYDGIDTLTTKVGVSTGQVTVAKNLGSLGPLNYLEITITKSSGSTQHPGPSISLNSVLLGSDSLGDFQKSATSSGLTCWQVTGTDVGAGFTLTGTLALTGSFGGGDSSFVQIAVGYVVPPDDEGPVTSNVSIAPDPVLLNGDATVTANVDDSSTGGSDIKSAEYSVNGGPWLPMDAQDNAFDEVSEDVAVTFTAGAALLGLNEVCVRGTDAADNEGAATCNYFLVTYQFDGFYSPIDNDLINTAKAGQAIPVKWRLTDADGAPIEDPASFVSLKSYPVSCDTLDKLDAAVDEYASGSSGLQYNGDGYWQFNWKTPKSYAGSCRTMYVEFDTTATSPVVTFQFK